MPFGPLPLSIYLFTRIQSLYCAVAGRCELYGRGANGKLVPKRPQKGAPRTHPNLQFCTRSCYYIIVFARICTVVSLLCQVVARIVPKLCQKLCQKLIRFWAVPKTVPTIKSTPGTLDGPPMDLAIRTFSIRSHKKQPLTNP